MVFVQGNTPQFVITKLSHIDRRGIIPLRIMFTFRILMHYFISVVNIFKIAPTLFFFSNVTTKISHFIWIAWIKEYGEMFICIFLTLHVVRSDKCLRMLIFNAFYKLSQIIITLECVLFIRFNEKIQTLSCSTIFNLLAWNFKLCYQ